MDLGNKSLTARATSKRDMQHPEDIAPASSPGKPFFVPSISFPLKSIQWLISFSRSLNFNLAKGFLH